MAGKSTRKITFPNKYGYMCKVPMPDSLQLDIDLDRVMNYGLEKFCVAT